MEQIIIKQRQFENALDVYTGENLFTTYVYDKKFAKPYLGPVILSNGESITRLDFETKEHPHQRSIFIAVGDVSANGYNNIDFWNEPNDRGEQRQTSIVINENSFTACNVWQTCSGVPLVCESRTLSFKSNGYTLREIYMEIKFTASYGEVIFGATKEAGPLGIRINPEMQGQGGNGFIINSWGGKGEGECWGKNAAWASYCGSVKGLNCYLTVYDDVLNERYPTSWHCRDYGLFAVNNLYFKGPLKIKENESLVYRYKIAVSEIE